MAKAHCCDNCGKLLKDSDIRITIDGFSVVQNMETIKMPKGFSIKHPQDLCSFHCVIDWARQNQILLDDYKRMVENKYNENDQ